MNAQEQATVFLVGTTTGEESERNKAVTESVGAPSANCIDYPPRIEYVVSTKLTNITKFAGSFSLFPQIHTVMKFCTVMHMVFSPNINEHLLLRGLQ